MIRKTVFVLVAVFMLGGAVAFTMVRFATNALTLTPIELSAFA